MATTQSLAARESCSGGAHSEHFCFNLRADGGHPYKRTQTLCIISHLSSSKMFTCSITWFCKSDKAYHAIFILSIMFLVLNSGIQTTILESHVAGGSTEFKQGFFSTHHWSQKVASSWPRSRDAGLVGRLTVGDITENKGREGNGKWRKQTTHISNPHINTEEKAFGAAVRHITGLHVNSAHMRGSHVKCMKHTTKLARKSEQSPTCFSTLSHVLEEERTAGPLDGAHFWLPPWWRVCDWGLSFAVFWREVTVLLNPKHLKYLRPPSLFHIKGMARSSRPVAAHEGSWDHVCLNWVKLCSSQSHYVIYSTVSLRVC